MVVVAQLVSASGCGPEGRRFKSGLPPHFFCQNFGKKMAATPPRKHRQVRSTLKKHLIIQATSGACASYLRQQMLHIGER